MKRVIIVAALIALLYALSWAICVGIIWLICRCFSWQFSLSAVTVVWLIICLIKGAMSSGKKE